MNDFTISKFYCTKCGHEGISIPRKNQKVREPGHLKKLFCIYCNKEVNHAECRGFGKYNYEDFLIEFKGGNFDEEGNRKMPWKQFVANYYKQEGDLNG